MAVEFKKGVHNKKDKYLDTVRGEWMADNQMDWYLYKVRGSTTVLPSRLLTPRFRDKMFQKRIPFGIAFADPSTMVTTLKALSPTQSISATVKIHPVNLMILSLGFAKSRGARRALITMISNPNLATMDRIRICLMRLRYDHQGLPMILLSTMKTRKLVPKIPGLLMSDMVCNLKSETPNE